LHNQFEIRQPETPSDEDIEHVSKHFRAFNNEQTGELPKKELHIFAYGPNGNVIGGLFGDISWGWLHVDVLWVDERYREEGIGSALMNEAQNEALAMKVDQAYLETTDFQASEFYKKLGFSIFAELENQPPGHVCYYMKKKITAPK
jgi:ribosomal protein S18 acetylase RimI-like enzyme